MQILGVQVVLSIQADWIVHIPLQISLCGAQRGGYEGGIRVPMIVKWPEKFSDSSLIVEEPVISTDFYPSLLEMAGLPARDEQALDGVSFVPALNGEPFNRGPIFWHFPPVQ